MAKVSKEEMARIQGLQRGLEIAEARGIEGLREEVRLRCATKFPIKCDMKDVQAALEEIQDNILSTVLLMSVLVLREEFEFGKKRIERYSDKFKANTEQLHSGDLTWRDTLEAMEQETGFTCDIDDYFLRMHEKAKESK